jgi:U3 small nucleolar ribonucleoprotein protein LCP5
MVKRSSMQSSDTLARVNNKEKSPKDKGKTKAKGKSPKKEKMIECNIKAQEYLDHADALSDELMTVDTTNISDDNEDDDAILSLPYDLSKAKMIISSLNTRVSDLGDNIRTFKDFCKHLEIHKHDNENSHIVDSDDIVAYLTAKQQMLASYCVNLLFYLSMKIKGKSVSNPPHPVLKQLLKIRLALEKMRQIDGKIKHQVERLIQQSKFSDSGDNNNNDNGGDERLVLNNSGANLRPNPLALLPKADAADSDDSDDSDGNDSNDGNDNKSNRKKGGKGRGEHDMDINTGRGSVGKMSSSGVYVPPRMEAAPYAGSLDSEKSAEKEAEKLRRKREKLRSSEIYDTIREEFSTAPEMTASSGMNNNTGQEKILQAEAKERQDFEEDRFVRLVQTRKEKKNISSRRNNIDRLDRFDDIGHVRDLDSLAEVYEKASGGSGAMSSIGKKKSRDSYNDDDGESSNRDSRSAKKGKKKMHDVGAAVSSSAAMERAAAAFKM